ncbi:thioredoxin [Longibaculum muris]|uniref:thioredoxin n=1 Tax=Longibaculum muris TaxID=1796628 RepID=UPI0012B8ADCA|nr:thioredoxin [Longibaculum muris]
MSNVLHVNSSEFNDVVANSDLVFVDFFATWCGPCKMLAPSVEKLADEHPEAKVLKVDVDQENALAMQFGVQSIPTLIVFKNGQPVSRQMGFMPYEALEDMLK